MVIDLKPEQPDGKAGVRRVFQDIGLYSFSLVVVNQFNIVRVARGETENNPPVGAHRQGPEAFTIARERMKIETGRAHVLDGLRLAS